MANKKQLNRQIERKTKAQRMMFKCVAIGIVALVVAAVVWVIVDSRAQRFIMTFEGQRIETNQLLTMASVNWANLNDPTSRDEQISNLVDYLILTSRADAHGLGLTQDDIFGMMLQGWPEDMAEIQAAFQVLPGRLAAHYVADYVPDMAVYGEELAEYIEENRNFYAETNTFVIVHQDPLALAEIVGMFEAGEVYSPEHFEALVQEHSLIQDSEAPVEPVSMAAAIQALQLFDYGMELAEMQTGDLSMVMEGSITDNFDGMPVDIPVHVLVYVIDRTEATDEDIEASFIDRLVQQHRSVEFWALFDEWVENADYTLHRRTINALS